MAEILFREPHVTDVLTLAARMRPADVAECKALGHDDLAATVQRSVAISLWSYAVHGDGELLCIMGVAPLGGRLMADVGVPWLLGTPAMLRHRGAFMRLSAKYIAAMLRVYPRLENVVHEENHASVAWLKRMGFALANAEPIGPRGARFHRFSMEV